MTGPRGTTAPERTRAAAAAAAAKQHSNTESQAGTDRVQQRPLSKPLTGTGHIHRLLVGKRRFAKRTTIHEGLF